MSGICYRCFKSKEACLCSYIKELDTGVKFVILIHPREARLMKTGTGRIAHLSLKDSELIQGCSFNENERVNKLLSDPAYHPFLLYPGNGAITTDSKAFREKISGKIPMIIILDGTWSQAKKMLKYSPNLQSIDRLSFNKGYSSRFIFKREPTFDAISTIEACYYNIKEMGELGLASSDGADNLISVFDRMVSFQLECERKRRELNAPERVPLQIN